MCIFVVRLIVPSGMPDLRDSNDHLSNALNFLFIQDGEHLLYLPIYKGVDLTRTSLVYYNLLYVA